MGQACATERLHNQRQTCILQAEEGKLPNPFIRSRRPIRRSGLGQDQKLPSAKKIFLLHRRKALRKSLVEGGLILTDSNRTGGC